MLLPSAAWAADPPDPGRTETGSYTSNGAEYPYLVYTPTSYVRPPAPLLVMVHGCQTTAEQQMKANLYNPIAEREGFVVLYPDVDALGRAQPGPTNQCWKFPYPAAWSARQQRRRRDRRHDARRHGARWPSTPSASTSMGMSAGGFMTSIEAAAYPDLYAAVGDQRRRRLRRRRVHSAPAPACRSTTSAQLAFDEMGPRARIVPRFVIGGDADQGIPPACADKALEQGLRTNNLVLGGGQDGPIALTPPRMREEQKPGGYAYTRQELPRSGRLPDRRALARPRHGPLLVGRDDRSRSTRRSPTRRARAAPRRRGRSSSATAGPTRAMPCAEAPRPVSIAATRCSGRTVSIAVPRGARAVRAWVSGRRATVRRRAGRARIRVPSGQPGRVRVVLRFRRKSGRSGIVRRSYTRCVPSSHT